MVTWALDDGADDLTPAVRTYEAVWGQFGGALTMLNRAIDACPQSLRERPEVPPPYEVPYSRAELAPDLHQCSERVQEVLGALVRGQVLDLRGGRRLGIPAVEGLRQEAGDKVRVTVVSPGFVHTDFAEAVPDADLRASILDYRDRVAIPPEAISRAVAFAIEQPPDVDVGEIVVRPTAQS